MEPDEMQNGSVHFNPQLKICNRKERNIDKIILLLSVLFNTFIKYMFDI